MGIDLSFAVLLLERKEKQCSITWYMTLAFLTYGV